MNLVLRYKYQAKTSYKPSIQICTPSILRIQKNVLDILFQIHRSVICKKIPENIFYKLFNYKCRWHFSRFSISEGVQVKNGEVQNIIAEISIDGSNSSPRLLKENTKPISFSSSIPWLQPAPHTNTKKTKIAFVTTLPRRCRRQCVFFFSVAPPFVTLLSIALFEKKKKEEWIKY